MLRGGPGYRECSQGRERRGSKRWRPGKKTSECLCMCVSKGVYRKRKDPHLKKKKKKKQPELG